MLADEVPFYVASDEKIVELQGEALKVLKALEAVIGHLRKFLVDHSVLPLFEKNVSLLLCDASCCISLNFYGLIIVVAFYSMQRSHRNVQSIPLGLTSRCCIPHLKLELVLIIHSHQRGNLCFLTAKHSWSHNSPHLEFLSLDKIHHSLQFVLQDLVVLVLPLLLRLAVITFYNFII